MSMDITYLVKSSIGNGPTFKIIFNITINLKFIKIRYINFLSHKKDKIMKNTLLSFLILILSSIAYAQ